MSWAVATHPGMRRSSNEDSYRARPDLGLFVIADGMGGHVAGEVASRLAVEAVEGFIDQTKHIDKDGTWPFAFEPDLSFEANRLKSGIRVANRKIGTTMADSAALQGMATTASAILIGPRAAIVGHVGDSRVYLLRGGELRRLTEDHSWVEEQVRAGTLSANDARHHPWRNVVTRALSGGEDVQVDIVEVQLSAGDRFLLCSDGLFGVVSDDRIGAALGATGELVGICEALIDAANNAGGPDNITAVLVEVDAP